MKRSVVVGNIMALAGLLSGCGETNCHDCSVNIQEVAKEAVHFGSESPTLYTNMTKEQQNAVVSLFTDRDDYIIGDYDYNYGFCTGVVISPHIIVSAAHCLTGTSKDEDGNQVEYSQTADDTVIHTGFDNSNPTGVYKLKEAVYPTNINGESYWQANDYSLDVAVLVLEEEIPNVTPIPLHHGWIEDLFMKKAQSVGYGVADHNHDGDNNTHRWWVTQTMTGYQLGQISIDGRNDGGVDHGDSGSPLLYDLGNGVEVIGNLSTGLETSFFAFYTPIFINEEWIRSYINKYDTPSCVEVCRNVECGEKNGCVCNNCWINSECINNICTQIVGGNGGYCQSINDYGADTCSTAADCSVGEKCIEETDENGQEIKVCRPSCTPSACSSSDPSSMCYPVDAWDDSYLSLCIESNPKPCPSYAEILDPCLLPDGSYGRCTQDLNNNDLESDYDSLYCFALCQPTHGCLYNEVCMDDLDDLEEPSCEEICYGKTCGTIQDCNCGNCNSNQECNNFFQCIDKQTNIDTSTDLDSNSDNTDTDTNQGNNNNGKPATDNGNQNSNQTSANQAAKKKGCNSGAGDSSILLALLMATGLAVSRRRKSTL